MPKELSEEEVFANDIDPLDAIREIRKEEGVAEEELPPAAEQEEASAEEEIIDDGADELEELQDDETEAEDDDTESAGEESDNADESEDNSEAEAAEDQMEDETAQAEPDADKSAEEVIKRTFKANGQEFEFTEQEILDQFEVIFGQAMDYTNKTKKLAPYRKMISALESENITADQLNLAIDALRGNPQALQTLMKANDVEAYDIANANSEEASPYVPTDYGKNEVQLGIDEVTSQIASDPEYKITVDVIDQQWDQNSRDALASNPTMIKGLHNDIKSGVYDKVAPVAMKMKVLDGNTKSDLDYYMLAGQQVLSAEQDSQQQKAGEQSVADLNKQAQDAEDNFDQASSEAKRKRSASPTRKRADTKGVTDYLDDDDEKFDAWYENLMASQ